MSDFHVDPLALERFAASCTDRQVDFDRLRTRMDSMRVPRDSFGYIPGIGGRVYDVYDQFVTDSAASLPSAAEAMAQIAEAVRATATAYTASDQEARDTLLATQKCLDNTHIEGVQ